VISVTKGPRPTWLELNQASKTAEYVAAPMGNKPRPWNNAELKGFLKSECRNKCMYCEVDPEDSSYPAIEHIKPKEAFPELVLEWENLGWACTRCNTNKGAYWSDHDDLRLLNPYGDDPAEHIDHAGPLVINAIGSERGKNTIRKLKLNRESLFTSKAKRIQELDERIQLWHRETDESKKDVLAEDVKGFLNSEVEFSAALRAFAATRNFPERPTDCAVVHRRSPPASFRRELASLRTGCNLQAAGCSSTWRARPWSRPTPGCRKRGAVRLTGGAGWPRDWNRGGPFRLRGQSGSGG
jgi:uncharacterized protein (TIGR02646 family)